MFKLFKQIPVRLTSVPLKSGFHSSVVAKINKGFPPRPKRPGSPFALFVHEEFTKGNLDPELSTQEKIISISSDWKTKSDSDKHPFLTKYSKLKKAYEKDIKEWTESLTSTEREAFNQTLILKAEKKGASKPKILKDPHAPKRPLSAYLIYCQEYRARNDQEFEGLETVEKIRFLGKSWTSLDVTSKAKYTKKAEELKEKYLEAVAKSNAESS